MAKFGPLGQRIRDGYEKFRTFWPSNNFNLPLQAASKSDDVIALSDDDGEIEEIDEEMKVSLKIYS